MLIPTNRESLKMLVIQAIGGGTAVGTPTGIAQNTAARISSDYKDYAGDPTATPPELGKQGAYNKARGDLTAAQAARREAIDDGRKLCADAVDALKAHLGRTWNVRWAAAGFGGSSISVKYNEVAGKLEELRNYFTTNPTHEVIAKGVTAVACEAARNAINAAVNARNAAKSAFQAARDARDASFRQLRTRMSGLQEELGKLLSDDDDRWAQFGFPRPIDGPMPDRVKGVTATPGLPGTLFVQWQPSRRAINYRVSWQLVTSGAETVEIGLFSDPAANLTGLPSGAQIAVLVTARNNAGETSATSVQVTVS